jgi:WD40 repeat protein
MTLKREMDEFGGKPLIKGGGGEKEKTFKKAAGLCLDVPEAKNNVYMVGTDDGVIHKCSTAYTEQDIERYTGHTGPVYQVRTNGFVEEVFLSCAADWTIRLWHGKRGRGANTTLASMDLTDAVNDVVWSHQNATEFAAVADDGRVEVWDLTKKPLDPIIVHYPGGREKARRRTCVRFSKNSPVLVAGDAEGKIAVMRLYNCEIPVLSQLEQQQRLLQCLSRNNN